ncbi:MAG: RNA polymerase sigma factor [Bacteroidales bacterium]|jgi:RNA polymerase sigma-70 factor (ECF subfamily)|nr:RNA polymerase sigma factor [Bacteroidales bacterium]
MKEKIYREVLEENYRKVFRLCLRYFGNTTEAEDAAQDVFVKVWMHIDKFRGESAISTWLYRIATNVCLTSLRNRKPETLHIDRLENEKIDEDDPDESNKQETGEKKIEFFNDYLSRLSPGDRTIVNLYLEDMDSKAISEITGLTDTNIRTRIHRIKNGIKKEWEEKYGT